METNWIELIEVHLKCSNFTENIQISKIIQSKRVIRLPDDKMQPRQQSVLNTDIRSMVAYAMCDSRFTICYLQFAHGKRNKWKKWNKTKTTQCLSSKSSPFFKSAKIVCADQKIKKISPSYFVSSSAQRHAMVVDLMFANSFATIIPCWSLLFSSRCLAYEANTFFTDCRSSEVQSKFSFSLL